MTRFRVFEPAGVEGRSDRAVFVADRFVPFALLFPSLWLLVNRLFLPALGSFALGLAVTALLGWVDFGASGATLIGLLVPGLVVALEGSRLRARKLRRRGFSERAVVTAPNMGEAEILYYMAEGAESEEPAPVRIAPASAPPATSLRRQPPRTLFDRS